MDKETVLITGASSGIGLELARLFAADKSDLVLVARRTERLEALGAELTAQHGIAVRVLSADLSKPESPEQVFRQVEAMPIDVLVNNAGFGGRGPFVSQPLDRQMDMIHVNVAAATHLARLLLPGMITRRRGGILNVASTAGFQPGPNVAVYYATKAYMLSFSEALTEEVRGKGVTVSCLAPGPTHTEFAAAANMHVTPLFRYAAMSAQAVARAGHRGFRRGKALVIPGLHNWLGAFSVRLAPRLLVRRVSGLLQA